MESLKIRDKKHIPEQPKPDEVIKEVPAKEEISAQAAETPEFRTEEQVVAESSAEKRRNKLTIGQKIMESVKKFFEEVE